MIIGVIANYTEQVVVREFFELFKTPWEFYRKGRQYEVVVCAGDGQFDGAAKLVVFYAGGRTHFDDEQTIPTGLERSHGCVLEYQANRLPIYGNTILFLANESSLLTDHDSGQCVGSVRRSTGGMLARVGYDLFGEVRTLLAEGQPIANADLPALELHIEFLRDLITGAGISLVEIPPVPNEFPFIACLTHDVDNPAIRRHKLDHTTLGFLYRAVFGSLRNVVRGRMTLHALVSNWVAVLKLPLIHLGLAKDFWQDFDERYRELEKGLKSTFFVIPFKGRPGSSRRGAAPGFRASKYGAVEISDTIQRLLAAGCEVGLHGIDAWLDESTGRQELEEIKRLTGLTEVGVRMHWLYFDQQSPSVLETSGAEYDSTIGYNETVGYRAGTTQAYKPLEADRLLELPLHVMDTALFYPAHLALSPEKAKVLLSRMIHDAARFGGCLTVNWHDRSIAPERLWEGTYRDIIEELRARCAWFATAGQAIAWFRKRRAVVFEADSAGALRARIACDHDDRLPRLRVRIHKARTSSEIRSRRSDDYVDMTLDHGAEIRILPGLVCSAGVHAGANQNAVSSEVGQ